MIFVDASALIAILAREADSQLMIAELKNDPRRLYSAVSRWETIAGLCKSYRQTPDAAADLIDQFFGEFGFDIVSIGRQEAFAASNAYKRYGRGRHPAALNMGDCFAYACAKSVGATLLYKGNDFSQTDLA